MGTPVEELTGLPCMVVWVIHAAGSPADREKGLVFTHPGATGSLAGSPTTHIHTHIHTPLQILSETDITHSSDKYL